MSDNFLKPIIDIDKKGSLRQRSPIYYRVGYLYIIKRVNKKEYCLDQKK